jgi:LytR cell envelope-related transcriptional attenuator
MDHYAPTHDFAHPWRTRTMIVSAVAAAELVALIAVGVLVLGKGWFQHARASAVAHKTVPAHHVTATTTHAARPPAPAAKPVAPAKPVLSRAETSVLVLNGNGHDGAAGDEATALRSHGYAIKAVGNAKRNDYAASMVMYRPGLQREALRLARDAGVPIVTALDGIQPSQLHGAKLLVIVGK